MELHSEALGDVMVARLKGDHLDASTVEDFKAAANPVIEKSMKIVLDMGSLNFVDSSGIGALMICTQNQLKYGGSLRLVSPSESVNIALVLTGLDKFFSAFASEAEALASF